VFFRGLLGCLLVSFVVCFGFFSGSRVFLLGFLVGFGLGPLGVFFGFFSFFLCWLWLLVYTSGVLRGALRFLINLLTYQKKKCSIIVCVFLSQKKFSHRHWIRLKSCCF
jgi:hypothetical protein